ncbi:MAG: replication initiation protein [Gammaproteobacteria bacterium]
MKQKRTEIKKHIATIHCANTLSLLQRKVSNALLFNAYDHLLQQEEHTISIKQLCELIDYKGHNYAAIKEALKGLLATVIEWNVIDEQSMEEDWSASSALSCVRIKGSVCTYAYSPRMRDLLYSPIMYGKISMAIQARFHSNYGLALYENCIRFKGLPYTKWFGLDIFRRLMGIPAQRYLTFRDFKKRVLDKSVQEVNDYSDLNITPELRKSGRTVTGIRFKLSEIIESENHAKISKDDTLKAKLMSQFNLQNTLAEKLLQTYGEEVIKEKMSVIMQSTNFKRKNIINLSGYLISALKDNYLPSIKSRKFAPINPQKISKEEHNIELYNRYLSENLDKQFLNLGTEEKQHLLDLFVEQLRNNKEFYILDKFNKQGVEDKIVKIIFRDFLKRVAKSYFNDLLSPEEFYQQARNHVL